MSFFSYRTTTPWHFDSHGTSAHHPSPLWPRWSQPFFSLPDPADVRGVSGCGRRPFPRWVVVRLIQGMCCGSSFVGSGRSTTILSIVAARSLRSSTFAPAITTPSGPPSPSVTMLFWVPFFPRSVGFLPVFFPPQKAGLAQHRVGRPPLPLHPAEFVSHSATKTAQIRSKIPLQPTPEPVVDSALGLHPLGQLVPLAAALPEDDRIQHFPPIGDLPPSRFLGPEFQRGSARSAATTRRTLPAPSGLRRGFRRTMAQSPVVVPWSGHCLLQAPSCKSVPPVLG